MRLITLFACCVILCSCGNNDKTPVPAIEPPVTDSVGNFFPLTTFLKGEIYEVKNRGMAPVRKKAGAKDSVFLKPEEFTAAFADFLSPVIDTANLKSSFTEAKFKDETLNAFTFSYDPIPGKGDDFPFTHWDVYVDPEKGTVNRAFLVKQKSENRVLQLIWLPRKRAKILELEDQDGKTVVIRDETISWSYD